MRRTRRGAGFALIPLLGVVTPLLILPILTSRFGESAWVAVAIGQSIGAAFVTVGELGWGLSGPQRVARQSGKNAFHLALLSLQSRAFVAIPLAPMCALVAFMLAPQNSMWAAAVAAVTFATSFSFAWFFLGISRPWLVVVLEALPRLAGLALSAIFMLWGAGFWIYPVLGLGAPAIFATVASVIFIARSANDRARIWQNRRVFYAIRAQLSAVLARSASAMYIALPISLVSIVAPDAVAVFAAGERILRICLGGLIAIPNAMQGWVGSSNNPVERIRRVRKSIYIGASTGLIGSGAFAVASPFVSTILFSGVATIPTQLAALFAVTLGIVCVSRVTGGIGLVAARQIDKIARSAILGAIIGVPAIIGLAALYGEYGGALGEIIAEGAVLTYQVISLRPYLSKHQA